MELSEPMEPGKEKTMKKITIKGMIENSNIPAKLIRSAIRQFGGFESFKELASDVSNYGINGGFHGFIYYVDTVAFFKRNRHEIMAMAENYADDFGTGVLEMIRGFNCMKGFEIDEIARVVYAGKGDCSEQIHNCLSWYAGEEVCRLYTDLMEQDF